MVAATTGSREVSMVASAPSVTTEWSVPQDAGHLPGPALAPPLASTDRARPRTRIGRPGLVRSSLVVGDLVAAIVTAGLLLPASGAALAPLWVAILASQRGYDVGGGAPARALRVSRAALVLSFAALVGAATTGLAVGPGELSWFVVTTAVVGVVARWGTGLLVRPGTTRVVVVGHRHGVDRMLSELTAEGSPFVVVGVCLTGARRPVGLSVPFVTDLDDLRGCVERTAADAVVVMPCRHLGPDRLRSLAWQLERPGTPLLVATGLHDLGPTRAGLHHSGPVSLIRLRPARLGGAGRAVKQVCDRVVAGLALVALAPLLVALAVAVRLETPGAALFRQTRIGRDGRPFTMLKLRTMSVDAEDRRGELAAHADPGHVLFKLRTDPRVTRIGRLLRTYSLDELPQLVNVVRGEMALVGPRPPLPDEVARYDADTRRRLAVTPGLTGLWQVSGRSDLSWQESVRLDLRYVENWSLGLDLRILARTVGAVLGHRGAY